MNYFDQDTQHHQRKNSGIISYVAIALICTVLGSMLSLTFAQKMFNKSSYVPNSIGTTTASTVNSTSDSSVKQISSSVSKTGNYPIVNISQTVGPAIVGIANFQSGNDFNSSTNLQETGSGSGIIIDASKGYIVTNYHVVSGAQKVVVSLADGRTADGTVVGADVRTDLAVIQIKDTKGLVAAQIGDSGALQVGEPVVAIGNPGGEEFARSVTTGVVSALNRILPLNGESSFNLIQTDAAINPGNSGGALVNMEGKVVGINSAKYQQTGFEGMGFAIPISDAWPVITQLMQTGHASHAGLEVSINQNYDENYAQARGMAEGALIEGVQDNGPAAQAGIQAGDIATSINGKTIHNYYDLTHELFKYKAGDSIKLVIDRNGTKLNMNLTLVELPNQE